MVTDRISLAALLERAEGEVPDKILKQLRSLGSTLLAEKDKRKRQPRPPAPAGGISISEASRKYEIPKPTIFRWMKAGYIRVIRNDKSFVYLDEERVSQLAAAYKRDPGRGSWAVKILLDKERNS